MGQRRNTVAAGVAVAALVLSACGSGGGDAAPPVAAKPSLTSAAATPSVTKVADKLRFEAGTTMAKIAAAGRMKVGTKFDLPGFGLRGLDGEVTGFDVEVAKIVAGELGVKTANIEWVESPAMVREELIAKGEVDLVAAVYTIDDKRKERVTFAGPYYVAGQQLMVMTDNATIKGPGDLKANPRQKVCSVTGSTPAEQIKKYLASDTQLVLFDSYGECADSLLTGQVQAVTSANVILLALASKSKDAFKLVGEQFTKEPYGIGIKKGDVKFCEFINKTLKDNEGAYNQAWANTVGKVKGATAAKLPEAAACS